MAVSGLVAAKLLTSSNSGALEEKMAHAPGAKKTDGGATNTEKSHVDAARIWKEPQDRYLEISNCDTPGLQGRPLILKSTDPALAEKECIRKCDDERENHAPHKTAMCSFERDNLDCWYHDLTTIKNPPIYNHTGDDNKVFVFGDPLLGQQMVKNLACAPPSARKEDDQGCTSMVKGWKNCPVYRDKQAK